MYHYIKKIKRVKNTCNTPEGAKTQSHPGFKNYICACAKRINYHDLVVYLTCHLAKFV